MQQLGQNAIAQVKAFKETVDITGLVLTKLDGTAKGGVVIGIVDEKRIDEINIYEATKEAMYMAIKNLKIKPEHVLIDAMKLDLDIPSTSIIKGDLLSISISAASVIAKVTRDHMLYEIDKEFPMYDLKNNKGYGTKKHLEAIKKYGITKYHRLSYKPVFDNRNKINNGGK